MVDVDPDTLLEWLNMGAGDERDMQLIALEQLCMLLLMSDNVDRCFESCPPRTFLPALCRILLDETAPENVLEVTARAITYYLDVSAECTRRIVAVDGAIKALCNRLEVVELDSRTSKDLGEQCVKVLELVCTREAGTVFEAGGLTCALTFIKQFGNNVHKDTLHSAMSVVSRLCGRMEPQDPNLEGCVQSLSSLLEHEDTHVAEGALRCFASLADRFTRRGVDPAPLAQYGLTTELLQRLSDSSITTSPEKSTAAAATPEVKGTSSSVSTVISLLSTLCRGSPGVTHDLLRSDLLDAIEQALQGDERCILDVMRLVDLLLVLLFEGRCALPKTSVGPRVPGLRRFDSSSERSHRQLIDCIRSKDTDALVDAIDNGGFEVNFMDDVGQTLLNWASAFGTLEMVEFLCERGADVNRGQRSSSLHYAACFGRPAVAKTLLRHGANPDLRDEDGKTPMDKARERNDEGHREVVHILQSPGEWMVPVASGSSGSKDKKEEVVEESPDSKGDPEMAPVYLTRLLPMYCKTFLSSMIPSVKKATLALIRKMIHYTTVELISDLAKVPTFGSLVVEVLGLVLDSEEDDDGHLTALQTIHDMLDKSPEVFMEHFARLGVMNRVADLAGPTVEETQEQQGITAEGEREEQNEVLEDTADIEPGKPYHWRDWCIVRSRDCLYLWTESCALELSNGSNGWFRFILDGKLATMYSSGSPEGGSDSSESRGEFLEKLQRARGQVRMGTTSQPILSSPGPHKIIVGNWSLSCHKEGELSVHNSDGQQATILKEDLPGFIFESNRGTKHTFTAETTLGSDFAAGWSGKRGRRFTSKVEQQKQKVRNLASELQEKYFKAAQSSPREVVAKLQNIVAQLYAACDAHDNEQKGSGKERTWTEDQYSALKALLYLLQDDNAVSSFELQTSGLVQALLHCLNTRYDGLSLSDNTRNILLEKTKERISVFKSAFGETMETINEESVDDVSPATILVRKLVAVLESMEKLPVYNYDIPGSGLQILTRRLRFRLERSPGENSLIDRTGRNMKMEPLVTIGAIEKYLLRMVAKQWYDYDRCTFNFVKNFKKDEGPVTFTHNHDFDDNGIIYWIGTNAKTVTEWVNPASVGLVVVTSSEGPKLPYGKLEDILSRESAALNCHTNDDKNAWFAIDLGVNVVPSCYTLRHSRGYGRSALRNWLFQVSKDGKNWITLYTHTDDTSLNEPGSTATWPLEPPIDQEGWRHVRIQQMGKNASGLSNYLSLSGFELYGKVEGVIDEPLGKAAREVEAVLKRKQRLMKSKLLKHLTVGSKVVRGWVDVAWGNSLATALRESAERETALAKGEVKVVEQVMVTESLSSGDEGASTSVTSTSEPGTVTSMSTSPSGDTSIMASSSSATEPGSIPLSTEVGTILANTSATDVFMDHEDVAMAISESVDTASTSTAGASDSSMFPEPPKSVLSTSGGSGSLLSRAMESELDSLNALRASTLVDLEDEYDLPEHDDEDDDEEEDDDENEEENEDYYEDVDEEQEHHTSRRRNWDDEYVLKRQFSALIPAFDPRPGRTNVNQTSDFEIPAPDAPEKSKTSDVPPSPSLRLWLRAPGAPGMPEVEIPLDDRKASIFKYIQKLSISMGGSKSEHLRRIWEPTYVITYAERKQEVDENDESEVRWTLPYVERYLGTDSLPKSEVISFLQQHADVEFLRRWKLSGIPKSIRKNKNCSQLVAAYKEYCKSLAFSDIPLSQHHQMVHNKHNIASTSSHAPSKESTDAIEDVLQLIRLLFYISSSSAELFGERGWSADEMYGFIVASEEFNSKKLTTKVLQQVQDALVLCSGALPEWCERLMSVYPMLFPFDSRQLYFNATGFGCSRSIVWLQNKRDAVVERNRVSSLRRDEQTEFRIGRLKHERVKVPRGEQLLEWAMNVMRCHSDRKAVLEIEFIGEEGTGLGPTLEFYALVAAEFQRKNLGLWVCDDHVPDDMAREVDIGHGVKARGYYVQRANGLFPVALPQDLPDAERVAHLFYILGVFIAKSLQDNRLVDLPLSLPFLKIMCSAGSTPSAEMDFVQSSSSVSTTSICSSLEDQPCTLNEDFTTNELDLTEEDNENAINRMELEFSKERELISEDEELSKEEDSELQKQKRKESGTLKGMPASWFAGCLHESDFSIVSTHKAKFLSQLRELVEQRKEILSDESLSENEKQERVGALGLSTSNGAVCSLEDLGLNFQVFPSSKVHGFAHHDLKPNATDIDLTLDNAEEYTDLVMDFYLHSGIRKQMESFRDGFSTVFSMDKLQAFTPPELQTLLCGEQVPQWTRDDIINYTEPKYGYTRESPGFQKFVNVLVQMNGDERKAFLQFTTGCSSLPPGGLANLHPRLTVVRKDGEGDGSYPSVNTCVHYLKLPDYSTEEILREKLLDATKEKGFHLN